MQLLRWMKQSRTERDAGAAARAKPSSSARAAVPPGVLVLSCCGSTDIPGRGSSELQKNPQKNPQLLLAPSHPRDLHAPAATDGDPPHLSRKPLHSQLLETASREAQSARPGITPAGTFGPRAAAEVPATALSPSSEIFQCLSRGTPPPPPRGSPRSPLQQRPRRVAEGSRTSEWLVGFSFLGPSFI